MAREGHLWTVSALVRLRGVFVYVCWHHSQALSFVNFAQLDFICHFNHQNYSPFPVIWVIKVIELDWLLLIQLLTRKLILKETIQATLTTNHDNGMLNGCRLKVLPKRLEFCSENSHGISKCLVEINKVRICHFYGIIAYCNKLAKYLNKNVKDPLSVFIFLNFLLY